MSKHPLLRLIFVQESNRFLVLLISLVFLFVLYPISEEMRIARLILNLVFMWIIFSAIVAISDSRRPLIRGLILASMVMVFRWWNYFLPDDTWHLMEHIMSVAFWGYIAIYILKFVFSQHKISSEVIHAALAVYFILGLAWASIYQILELHHAHSFAISNPETLKQDFTFQMWYFSMVTLTTLGFGDISPITMVARVFVVLEAIMGQIYLAVLMANLVGRWIVQGR